MSTERWHAVGRWVVEDCAEQPEEPMPLFQCDLPANAVTVANIYNEVCAERDAAVAENARLLVRIAAVEAAEAEIRAEASEREPEWHSPAIVEDARALALRWACKTIRAALAASPTPTGPETEAKR